MKLTVFQAGKGDSLLLRSGTTNVLVDGGMREDYKTNVAPALGAMRERGEKLDAICVSHIDRDHISGVLQLFDDEIDWRVFKFQRDSGNARFPEPERPRPPVVKQLWHNAFRDQVEANAGEIEELLAARATLLELSDQPRLRARAPVDRELATSISEGIELTHRAGPAQLKIPVNKPFGGKLALVRDDSAAVRLGPFRFTVIGPFTEDLADLRKEWNVWLRDEKDQLQRLRRRMQRDAERLPTSELGMLHEPLRLAADELGNRAKVTVPNLASLMLLCDVEGRTILLTGDGHWREILKGLEHAGRLDPDGALHVDVLKVQHHGSEHNLNADFARRVTADRYLFCANGEHANPDPRIVAAIVESRLGPAGRRSTNPAAAGPFQLLFNSSGDRATTEGRHMSGIEADVAAAARQSGGRLKSTFANTPSFAVNLRRRQG